VHPAISLVAYHSEDNTWVHMATGQTVAEQREIDAEQAKEATVNEHSSSLWWLDGKDTSKMSFNEVSELAIRAGDLRDEMQRQGDPPERIAEVDREYQRLLEAQQAAGQRMNERRAARADPPPPSKESPVNDATKGAIEGASQVTPTGLATAAASAATGKDIKSPLAAAATGGGTSGGGSGMSSMTEARGHVSNAKQQLETSAGAAQQIIQSLEEALQSLMAGVDESEQNEASEAIAQIQQLISSYQDLQGQASQVSSSLDGIRT
jgi:hypothetical protein